MAKCATISICVTFWVSVVVVIIVILATSIKKLEDFEVGLQYNPNSVHINEGKLYTAGTYFLGPGHKFIKFNKNLRTIQFGKQTGNGTQADLVTFSLNSRTSDALQVDIICSFQYRLTSELADLLEVYKNWGEDYENTFVLLARNIIRDAMAEFKALQVFYERSSLESTMRTAIIERLLGYHAIVESFQLLDISLPAKLNQALIDTEQLNLNITTTQFKKQEEIQKAQGKIDKALQDASVIINNASAFASQVTSAAQGKADTIRAKVKEQKDVISLLKFDLGMNDRQLASYYFYNMLEIGNYGDVSVNIETPRQIQCFYDKNYCV